ncbi:MAG: hypothetical protein HW409_1185 [candidate division NC10 bacterium]|nr:hypothetical protein [candidate division NC10 bacterium]
MVRLASLRWRRNGSISQVPAQGRSGSGASPQGPIVTDRPREHPRNLLPGDSRARSFEGSRSSRTYTPDLRTRARNRQESHRHIDGFAPRGVRPLRLQSPEAAVVVDCVTAQKTHLATPSAYPAS